MLNGNGERLPQPQPGCHYWRACYKGAKLGSWWRDRLRMWWGVKLLLMALRFLYMRISTNGIWRCMCKVKMKKLARGSFHRKSFSTTLAMGRRQERWSCASSWRKRTHLMLPLWRKCMTWNSILLPRWHCAFPKLILEKVNTAAIYSDLADLDKYWGIG